MGAMPPEPGFLPASLWADIQQHVPIVCVDVLPMRNDRTEYGLILRETADEGQKLCLVGGRILRNETVAEAVSRQLLTTLGPDISFDPGDDPQPAYVAQYFPEPRPDHSWDSRKHAVALTFVIDIAGSITPREEALDFVWRPVQEPPLRAEMGFAQHRAVHRCLEPPTGSGEHTLP